MHVKTIKAAKGVAPSALSPDAAVEGKATVVSRTHHSDEATVMRSVYFPISAHGAPSNRLKNASPE